MARARRSKVDDSATRTALLDAAEALMIEEGYAAVTTRRLAAKAGLNNGLVYYYFGTMDELFIELFRRGVDQGLQHQAEVLESPQPLWGLWELIHDFSNNALMMEFIALANHRKAIRAEIAAYSTKIRTLQMEKVSGALEGYGVDPEAWPPATVVLLMVGISRFLVMEEAFDVDLGHMDMVRLIERHIRVLEGDRVVARPPS
jgi:AcrR family transcriptional regulator